MLGICVDYNVLLDVGFFNVLAGIDFCSSWIIRMVFGGLVGFVISGLIVGFVVCETGVGLVDCVLNLLCCCIVCVTCLVCFWCELL